MAHPIQLKQEAIRLRKIGISIPKIAKKLHIAKSTTSDWVSSVPLPWSIQKYLKNNSKIGQEKGREVMRIRRLIRKKKDDQEAKELILKLKRSFNKDFWKLLVAILFWCEGSKRHLSGGVGFINSDPYMINQFLYAFRKAFPLNESKFRITLHLHSYHSEKEQIKYWSHITRIPSRQFSKSYIKPNTGTRKRSGYPGCVSLKYYDSTVAQKLDSLYRIFTINYWGVS